MVKGVSGNFLELITSNLLIGLKLGFNKKVLELKWEFLLAVGFGSSFDFSSFEKLYLELGLWWLKHQISKKIQNSKHQQYINWQCDKHHTIVIIIQSYIAIQINHLSSKLCIYFVKTIISLYKPNLDLLQK